MKTIYLDQMKWIDLARAATGHPLGVDYVGCLEVFQRAVDDGRARFPLSAAHYYETSKQHNIQRRVDVATVMTRLSDSVRLAPPHVIVPWEARRALAEVLGLPLSTPDIRLLGFGAAHAFDSPSLGYSAPETYGGISLSEPVRATLQDSVGASLEWALLSSTVPDDVPEEARVILNRVKGMTDARFVSGQEYVADELLKLGRHRLDDVMLATAIADIVQPLQVAATSLRVSLNDDIIEAGRMRALIEHMPSRWVEMMLRRQRQANAQKAWHGNDLNDVTALAIAVPYCDAVVTERSWSALLNAVRVPQRFGTVVTPRLEDVVEMLR
jgi:hypothetical protein